MLVGAMVSPHPPIIIPEIGKNQIVNVTKTVEAMKTAADKIAALEPEILAFISPHSPIYMDGFAVKVSPQLQGSFSNFGCPNLVFSETNQVDLAKEVIRASSQKQIPTVEVGSNNYGYNALLDHGVLVPYYYLKKKISCSIISLSISTASLEMHFQYGELLGQVFAEDKRRIAFIASGDLSHRLTRDAQAGYSPRGIEFDTQVSEIISSGNLEKLLEIDLSLIEAAGECGLRSLVVLAGMKSEVAKGKSELLSYEGPFGVGYLVAVVLPER